MFGTILPLVAFAETPPARSPYPESKKVDQVDDFHGTKVADPYRWLENLDSAETAAWVDAQNAVTFGMLEQIPAREPIQKRLLEIWNYERYTAPNKTGDRYFFSRNDGLQNQSVMYWATSLSAAPTVLLDPNTLSKDGTVAISSLTISDDGKKMAYGLSSAGSDWVEMRVRNVDTGADLPDVLKWIKFSSAAWTPDNKGFYYSRYDEPPKDKNQYQVSNYNQKLYYHEVGTPQSADKLIYERPDHKEWGFGAGVTDDGKFLIISISQGTEQKNRVYYQELGKPDAMIVPLLDGFDAEYEFIDNEGPIFWFKTDKDAPRSRIIAIDLRKPQPEHWQQVVAETEDTMQGANLLGNRFFVTYLKNACTTIGIYDLAGKRLGDVPLPGLGSAGGFGGKRSDTETFYSYTSFTVPPTIFRYDLKTDESTAWKQSKVNFQPDRYVTTQISYPSKDGTKIPMFLTHRRDLQLNGENPTLLYGYGGFNIPITPAFSPAYVVWLELGGIYAVANIRGGGEFGTAWHDAGRLKNKQNVFDDFIAAGEWLIANKYTRSSRLAIHGRSNGGLLVGACMTQRPDLFGAALPGVGVLDMLRFHKFSIGWAWTSDYGCADKPDDFSVLYAYSPLHNLKPGTSYPATMITTGDHDDRVDPSHSFKFAAALQAAQAGSAPTLIRIEKAAGHGAGKPLSKQVGEWADQWAFLVKTLDVKVDLGHSSPLISSE
ncbi:MAG: prolyl oligopeptidase family serine peptidase [Phycisphaerae bacterium]|nr:prolyl oligopeptidase family serine peptidase [Phycisphaerae bacterium]